MSCSVLRAAPAPSSPFLEFPDRLHENEKTSPWDRSWSADPKETALVDQDRFIYVAPVRTDYLGWQPAGSTQDTGARRASEADVHEIALLIRSAFVEALNRHPEARLRVVAAPRADVLILELALTELHPALVAANTVADVGAVVLPGGKVIEQAIGVGTQAVGGAIAQGSIAIEMKLLKDRKVLAEAKDRETDPLSILPNYRDFEQFGWSRHTIREWADQFARIFSSAPGSSIEKTTVLSVFPW